MSGQITQPPSPASDWEDVDPAEWEDVAAATAQPSTPAGPFDDYGVLGPAFNGIARGGIGLAKGLGDAANNLGRLAQTGMAAGGIRTGAPLPSRLEALEAGPGEEGGKIIGRFAPSVALSMAAPQGFLPGLAADAMGGAASYGTPEGVVGNAAGGAVLRGAGGLAMKAPGAVADLARRGIAAAGDVENPILKKAIGYAGTVAQDSIPGGTTAWRVIKDILKADAPKASTATKLDSLKAAAEEAKALLQARKSAEMAAEELGAGTASGIDDVDDIIAARYPDSPTPPTRAANTGTEPGLALKPPPGMGASSSPPPKPTPPVAPASSSGAKPLSMETPPGFKTSPATGSTGGTYVVPKGQTKLPTTGGGRKADLPPLEMEQVGNVVKPAGKVSFDDAIKQLQAATTPQERGAIIRSLAKGERGGALSELHASKSPLDPDDAKEAASFLKEAGSLDEALRLIHEHPENSVQDVIRLTRAVREASRRAK